MLRNAWRTRASSPATSVLVAGSIPRMPATKTKSPARAPSAHGRAARPRPAGASVFTPFGAASAIASARRHAGLQRERVQDAAHLALERRIDQLMLLHARLAAEALGNDRRGVVVAVAGKIADRHLGVRDARLDQALDLAGVHRHAALLEALSMILSENRYPLFGISSLSWRRPCRRAASLRICRAEF